MASAKKPFYITTTLPYVNASPHIGFALELVQADVVARFHAMRGEEVVFNTGVDEHGAKIYRKALEAGKNPQEYVDEYAKQFEALNNALSASVTNFIRTTDPHHERAAQEFWRRCEKNGDIYKKTYAVKYCVGCELEKTDSELESGRCPIHPHLELETLEEENYFFRFSRYEASLRRWYAEHPDCVLPQFRMHEIDAFAKRGFLDFSISRLKEKMPWGIPVPGDESQVMYVWFDALINYISTLGWPEDEKHFEEYWGTVEEPRAVQIAGKDNLRQQAAMWQAMLLSAGLPLSKRVLIHGFLTSGGQKMSKSLGNVVDPFSVVKTYGTDPVRYFLLREIPSDEDGDFSEDQLKKRYQGDLANGLGNFVARVVTLGEQLSPLAGGTIDSRIEKEIGAARDAIARNIEAFKLHEAVAALWQLIQFGDGYVNEKKPWAISDAAEKAEAVFNLVVLLDNIAALLVPFLPGTAQKITSCLRWEGDRLHVTKGENLFPRLS